MKVDIAGLKRVADKVNQRAREVQLEKAMKEALQQRLFEQEQHAIAERILASVEFKCTEAAEDGRYDAKIMVLDWDRDMKVLDHDPKSLKNAGKIVFDALVETGLKPYIYEWHDGFGMESRHEIWVNFGG